MVLSRQIVEKIFPSTDYWKPWSKLFLDKVDGLLGDGPSYPRNDVLRIASEVMAERIGQRIPIDMVAQRVARCFGAGLDPAWAELEAEEAVHRGLCEVFKASGAYEPEKGSLPGYLVIVAKRSMRDSLVAQGVMSRPMIDGRRTNVWNAKPTRSDLKMGEISDELNDGRLFEHQQTIRKALELYDRIERCEDDIVTSLAWPVLMNHVGGPVRQRDDAIIFQTLQAIHRKQATLFHGESRNVNWSRVERFVRELEDQEGEENRKRDSRGNPTQFRRTRYRSAVRRILEAAVMADAIAPDLLFRLARDSALLNQRLRAFPDWGPLPVFQVFTPEELGAIVTTALNNKKDLG